MNRVETLDPKALEAAIDAFEIETKINSKSLKQGLSEAIAAYLSTPTGGGEAMWRDIPVDEDTLDYVSKYGGRCRDCADEFGICPGGLPCQLDQRHAAIRHVLRAINYGMANGYLRAALSTAGAAEPVAWRSIETAPKDGTKFLAYERNGAPDQYPCWCVNDQYECAFWQNDYDSEPNPSHWRPLASPPSDTEEKAPHKFQTNGPGVIGSDLCTICGKERQHHD